MDKKCKKCNGPIQLGPKSNNKKFCSVQCRKDFSYESGKDKLRWTKANNKTNARTARYAPGKIQCLECGGWYKAPLMHAWQAHSLNETEYKKKHGLDNRKGLLIANLKEVKRDHVFENGTVENLKKGKSTRYKKGQIGVGLYKRSAQTQRRLKNQFKLYGPHAKK